MKNSKKQKQKTYILLGGKMKKLFSFIGLATISILSFIISEKTTLAVKEVDNIMAQIKQNMAKYKTEPENAIIKDNTIIPGINGKTVNINKSYKNMKKINMYNDKYFIYEEQSPEITIKEQYDKYIISGNPKKNTVSIIFTVKNNDKIDEIINILKKTNTNATFFIDKNWLEKNNDKMIQLINQGNTIGNLSNNLDYTNDEYIRMNRIIKKIGQQKTNYCYAEKENEKNIQECKKQRNYTIMPNIIITTNPMKTIKHKIKPGTIISMPVNETTTQELELIIEYINKKGYIIENIENHISETIQKNNN